jgi:transposase-like protein
MEMDTSRQYCPNPECPDYGKVGAGNIVVHSRKEHRFRCKTCGKIFAATYGTPLYRRHYDPQLFVWVISLLAHGCPKQAIVATFELDPRTVEDWWESSGQHSRQVHQATVGASRMDLVQVQMDEIRHKIQGAVLWIAMAIAVSTRLWLGATVSLRRDKALIVSLVEQVKAIALPRPLLLCFDGLKSYISACRQVFRAPLRTGKRGRPRLVPWPDIHLGQVVKRYAQRRVVGVERRLVQGSQAVVNRLLNLSQGGGVLNTAFIERLNATFRSRLALLVRRTRHLARRPERVEAAIYLVGCVYNFCTYHDSLRLPLYVMDGRRERRRWVPRTPAMAAGLTDHRWTVLELPTFKVPPLLPGGSTA